MRTARSLFQIAPVALALGLMVPSTAAWAGVVSSHHWEFHVNGAQVGSSGQLGGPAPGRSVAESFDGHHTRPFPGNLGLTAQTRVVADLDARRIGVGAVATAQNVAWNEDLGQVPEVGDARVTASVLLTDRIFLFSPSVGLFGKVVFGFQPLRLEGELSVPDPELDRGTGVASMLTLLTIQQMTPAPVPPIVVPPLEHIITGDPETRWTAPGLVDLAEGDAVTVANGKFYSFSLLLQVSVDAIAGPRPSQSPYKAIAEGSFDHTLTWQGFTGFYDEAGNRLTDVQFISDSGFDWVTPVPEPQAWALMLAGLAGLAGWHRRGQGRRAAALAG